ncbi:MAG: nucleotidyltransferase family protein, partial [Bacteroidota bacterium]|nr:nucleotidyltransferase family protein [Bacteroidota bacterium]
KSPEISAPRQDVLYRTLTHRRMVTAILLAAGESRRMGRQNKLLLPIGNSPMVRHVAEHVLGSDTREVIVVCGYQEAAIRSALAGLEVAYAQNPDYARGLASSVQVGIRAASPAATGYMVCLGDLPGLEVEDYNRIMSAFEMALSQDTCAIVRPAYAGTPGHPVVISVALRRDILSLPGRPKGRSVIQCHSNHLQQIPWNHAAVIRDVDTPEGYLQATGARPCGQQEPRSS